MTVGPVEYFSSQTLMLSQSPLYLLWQIGELHSPARSLHSTYKTSGITFQPLLQVPSHRQILRSSMVWVVGLVHLARHLRS